MTAIELDAQRANIVRMIFNTDDERILSEIEMILKEETSMATEEYPAEALREAVRESEVDIQNGRIHTVDEVRALFPRI